MTKLFLHGLNRIHTSIWKKKNCQLRKTFSDQSNAFPPISKDVFCNPSSEYKWILTADNNQKRFCLIFLVWYWKLRHSDTWHPKPKADNIMKWEVVCYLHNIQLLISFTKCQLVDIDTYTWWLNKKLFSLYICKEKRKSLYTLVYNYYTELFHQHSHIQFSYSSILLNKYFWICYIWTFWQWSVVSWSFSVNHLKL